MEYSRFSGVHIARFGFLYLFCANILFIIQYSSCTVSELGWFGKYVPDADGPTNIKKTPTQAAQCAEDDALLWVGDVHRNKIRRRIVRHI